MMRDCAFVQKIAGGSDWAIHTGDVTQKAFFDFFEDFAQSRRRFNDNWMISTAKCGRHVRGFLEDFLKD